MNIRLLPLAIVVLCALLMPQPLMAQQFQATITGSVTDPSGAVIPDATITVVEARTNVKSTTKTNGDGIYSLPNLLAGTYTVTVTAPSFQAIIINHQVLNSEEKLGLNITLQPGKVTQKVVVNANAVTLNTRSATQGGTIDQAEVEHMPANGMEIFDDLAFVDGIEIGSLGFNITPRNNSVTYKVAGAQTNANSFYLNGAPISDEGKWHMVPSQMAVAQVVGKAHPYDAQYGRTQGGAFDAIVKHGTNHFHGSFYDFYGNTILNANETIANLHHEPNTQNIRNTYGAWLGGPIVRNKTFFFGGFESFRQLHSLPSTSTVPPLAWRTGDFSGSGYTIYDPLSTYCAKKNTSGGCTLYSRKPFPNDTIPADRISPIGKAIVAEYPNPQNDSDTANFFDPGGNYFAYTQYIVRIDQNFTEKTKLYGLFAYQHDLETTLGNGFPGEGNTKYSHPTADYNGILDFNHVFSPTLVLDLKAYYGHITGITTHGTAVQDNYTANKLGFNMPYVGTTSHQNIVPTIGLSNETGLFGNTGNGSEDNDADFQGSITQLLGRNNLHYGGEFLDMQLAPTGVLGNPNGSFGFGVNFTQENPFKAHTGQGNSVADLLLGYPSSGSLSWDTPTFITLHYYGLYLQDDYQAMKNLTLTLGLRWDVNTSPRDRHNRINAGFCLTCTNPYTSSVNFGSSPYPKSPLLGGLLFAGVNGAPSAPYKVQWNDYQPRLGFSWLVRPDAVIRGGYGIFYPWGTSAVDTAGFSETTGYVASLDGNLTPSNYLNSGTPYPDGAIKPTGSSLGLKTNAGNGVSYNDTKRKLRVVQNWSIGIQQRLPFQMLFGITYVGSTDHHLPVTSQLGVIPNSLQASCNQDISLCNTNVPNPFYGVLPANTGNGSSPTIQQWRLQRAYPLFNGLSEQRLPIGSAHYNALDVHIQRRIRNLNFVANYIYSNWIDHDTYLNSGKFQDTKLQNTLDGGDRRNYAAVDVLYPLPTINKRGILRAMFNGWLTDSTLVFFTGAPMRLPSADFSCPSLIPAGGQTRAHWFNNDESCWHPLGPWERRTTPDSVGFLRDPTQWDWNASVAKQFRVYRRLYAHFRLQAYNVANHPTFGGPSTNVSQKPKYSPSTNWTGLGTLPARQNNQPRALEASLKFTF